MKKILLALLAMASIAHAEIISENFATDPATRGWQTFGNTNLFHWDTNNQNLAVTWDSSQPNSYFYHSLSNFLGAQDGFTLQFDLRLADAVAGSDTFEVALGFLNLSNATSGDFFRGSGFESPNLVEFDYFPPTAFYGASIDATLADTSTGFQFYYIDNISLSNNVTYHVRLNHAVGDTFVTANIYTDGTNGVELFTTLSKTFSFAGFGDYFVDTISVSSYSDVNAYGSSVLAHGTVDNLLVTTQPRPVGNFRGLIYNGTWFTEFSGRTNWNYNLERSEDLRTWSPASFSLSGTNDFMQLFDMLPHATNAFYRIHASQ